LKKEVEYEGIKIVFDNPQRKLDSKRILLINSLILYSNFLGKELRVIFFHGEEKEEGLSCYYKKQKVE
jgi:hypothetical protein